MEKIEESSSDVFDYGVVFYPTFNVPVMYVAIQTVRSLVAINHTSRPLRGWLGN